MRRESNQKQRREQHSINYIPSPASQCPPLGVLVCLISRSFCGPPTDLGHQSGRTSHRSQCLIKTRQRLQHNCGSIYDLDYRNKKEAAKFCKMLLLLMLNKPVVVGRRLGLWYHAESGQFRPGRLTPTISFCLDSICFESPIRLSFGFTTINETGSTGFFSPFSYYRSLLCNTVVVNHNLCNKINRRGRSFGLTGFVNYL